MDLTELSAIKREKPTSEADFSFRVVTPTHSIRLDPGSKAAFEQWQDGLTACVAVPSPLEQARSMIGQ